MENLRFTIETWGGNTTSEQLADAVTAIMQQLSGSKSVNCTVEGVDQVTASYASNLLIRDGKVKLDEARVNRYGALTVKYRP